MRRMTNMLMGASALVLLGGGAAWADVTIATAGPMTGQYAVFGEQMKRGAEMAVKDINAKGGVNGEQLVLEIGDDACDPKQAVAVANQFVNDEVKFVAGHFCSGSLDPGLGGLQRGGHPADLARLDQPASSPSRASTTSSAPAAATTSRASTPPTTWSTTRPARRSRSSTTRRPTARASPTSSRRS